MGKSMSDPMVCCIMLTRDRPEMARRAVECFRSQTYQNKRLLVYNTGSEIGVHDHHQIAEVCVGLGDMTIGSLRNEAAAIAGSRSDIICHWDDDDWSHPNRISEQVALLQASVAECAGYREVLFWRTQYRVDTEMGRELPSIKHDQAWLYSRPSPYWVIGSSFCYWRSVWEKHPFPDLPARPKVKDGSTEDVVWRRGVKCVGVVSIAEPYANELNSSQRAELSLANERYSPRMICSIHGRNSQYYEIELYPDTWSRAPQWDAHCREVMKL